jgi:hypothetical protein
MLQLKWQILDLLEEDLYYIQSDEIELSSACVKWIDENINELRAAFSAFISTFDDRYKSVLLFNFNNFCYAMFRIKECRK